MLNHCPFSKTSSYVNITIRYCETEGQISRCQGQRLANLGLSLTARSSTQCCPGQRAALLSAVLDSAQLFSVLSWTARSSFQWCPGQRAALLSAVLDSPQFNNVCTVHDRAQLYSVLSWTAGSLTQHCPGQRKDQLSLP